MSDLKGNELNSEYIPDESKRCPKCGASEVKINVKTGKLRCDFCRFVFEDEKFTDNLHLDELVNLDEISYGRTDTKAAFGDNFRTIKCTGCGSLVTINASEATHSRCHWCRTRLSIDNSIDSGLVPDMILPFVVSKEEARKNINAFLSKRSFFAKKEFKDELNLDNIYGVYLPYILVDFNEHVSFSGTGERTISVSGDKEKVYTVEQYHVEREFDLLVDDYLIESNTENLNLVNNKKSTNILNSLLPFDTENSVKFSSNYLIGFSTERRDLDSKEIGKKIEDQLQDINKGAVLNSISQYKRGVAWDNEDYEVKGKKYLATYLPFWIYGYKDRRTNYLHYIGVNGRSKKTNGNVPVDKGKLGFVGLFITILLLMLAMNISDDIKVHAFSIMLGIFIWFKMYNFHTNIDSRFRYEFQSKTKLLNLRKKDTFIRKYTTKDSSYLRANHMSFKGSQIDGFTAIKKFGASFMN